LHVRHFCNLYIARQNYRLASVLEHTIFLIVGGIHHEERSVYLAGDRSLRSYRMCNDKSTTMWLWRLECSRSFIRVGDSEELHTVASRYRVNEIRRLYTFGVRRFPIPWKPS
jgi:hypothetical protein